MAHDIGSVADWKITSRQERGRTSSKVSLSDLSSPSQKTTGSNNKSIVLEMKSLIFMFTLDLKFNSNVQIQLHSNTHSILCY